MRFLISERLKKKRDSDGTTAMGSTTLLAGYGPFMLLALLATRTEAYTDAQVCPTYGETYSTSYYSYSSTTYNLPCSGCLAGSYVYKSRSSYYCKPCPAGKYQPDDISKYDYGREHCILCEKGTFASGKGNSECDKCSNNDPEETGADTCSDIPFPALVSIYVIASIIGVFLLYYFRETLYIIFKCFFLDDESTNSTPKIELSSRLTQVEPTDADGNKPITVTVVSVVAKPVSISPGASGFCGHCGASNSHSGDFCIACGKGRSS